MTSTFRDCSLTGPGSRDAVSFDQWYVSPVPRQRLKQLMRRDDRTALWNYALWLALLLISGVIAYLSWGSWYAVRALMVYGVL